MRNNIKWLEKGQNSERMSNLYAGFQYAVLTFPEVRAGAHDLPGTLGYTAVIMLVQGIHIVRCAHVNTVKATK